MCISVVLINQIAIGNRIDYRMALESFQDMTYV